MTLKLRTTRVACATVDGTQDITISGFGTPVAAVFKLIRATSDGVAADHSGMSFGATDGTRQWVNYCFWEHGVTTTDTYGNHAATALIRVLDAAGATEGEAAFSAWVTDGVRINWTNAPPAAYLLEVTLIGGTDAAGAYAGTYVQNAAVDGVTDVTAPGFRPTDLILSRVFSNAGTMGINIGLVHEDGAGTVTQGFMGITNRDGQATSQLGSRVSNTYGIGMVLYTGEVYSPQEISAFDASGFSSTTRLNNTAAASGVVCYLALRITNHSTYKGSFTTPTATGNNAQTGPGFKPQFVMQLVGGCEANDTVYTDNRAGSFGASFADATAQYCGSISGEDGAGTSNTQSLSDDLMVNLPNHDGTGRWATSFVSFDANGFTQNFTATHSTGAIWLYWAVQEEAGGNTYEDAVTMNRVGQITSVANLVVASSISLSRLAAVIDSSQAQLFAALTLNRQAAVLDVSQIDLYPSLTLAVDHTMEAAGGTEFQAATSLARVLVLTATPASVVDARMALDQRRTVSLAVNAIYTAALALAQTLSVSPAPLADYQTAISLLHRSALSTLSEVGTQTYEAALTLARRLAVDTTVLADQLVSVSLARTLAADLNGEAVLGAQISLSRSIALSVLGGLLLEGALTLHRRESAASGAALTVDASIGLGRSQGLSDSNLATLLSQLDLGRTISLSASVSAAYTVDARLGRVLTLTLQGGQTYTEQIALDLVQAISTLSQLIQMANNFPAKLVIGDQTIWLLTAYDSPVAGNAIIDTDPSDLVIGDSDEL